MNSDDEITPRAARILLACALCAFGQLAHPEPVTPFLTWPVEQAERFTDPGVAWVCKYFDHDPGPGVLDYYGGDLTRDNHRGTDICAWPFPWRKMNHGQLRVVAAAGGTITALVNSYQQDQNCELNNKAAGNYIEITHTNGFKTQYWHMQYDSFTDKVVGQPVVRGEFLGMVGSSGSSYYPHLHLLVADPDDQRLDPFNADPTKSLWAEPIGYRPPQFHGTVIGSQKAEHESRSCPEEELLFEKFSFLPGEAVHFTSFFTNQKAEQSVELSLLDPNMGVIWQRVHTNDAGRLKKKSVYEDELTLPVSGLGGVYTLNVSHEGKTASFFFEVLGWF